MSPETIFQKPRWLRDLLRFLPLKSQFLLSDNVRDLQVQEVNPGIVAPLPMLQYLTRELREFGYAHAIGYDPVTGFRMLVQPGDDATKGNDLLRELGLQPANGSAPAGLDLFSETIQRIIARPGEPIAVVADFASRLIVRNDSLSTSEHQPSLAPSFHPTPPAHVPTALPAGHFSIPFCGLSKKKATYPIG